MGSSGWGFDGQVEDGTNSCVDECVHLTNLAQAIKTKPARPITLTNRTTTNTNTTRQPSKKAQRRTLATLLHTAKPLDTIPYTTSVSTHGPGIPSSAHGKKHQTCFAWYHGMCALRGKNCRFLHALTQPISFVQPPEGFVHVARRQKSGDGDGEDGDGKDAKDGEDGHGKENEQEVTCTLDWCPGDWLWDHDYSDNSKDPNEEHEEEHEEIPNEQGEVKNFGLKY